MDGDSVNSVELEMYVVRFNTNSEHRKFNRRL